MLNSKVIDNVLNRFLQDNDFDCTTTMSTDFFYYWEEELITYSIVVSERMDRMFLDFAKRKGLKVDCGIFLLSFFHELGHHLTIDNLTDEEDEECEAIKETLTDNDADCEKYFSVLDEWLATSWAIDYINNNTEQIRQLAEDVQTAIQSFIEENNIEEI